MRFHPPNATFHTWVFSLPAAAVIALVTGCQSVDLSPASPGPTSERLALEAAQSLPAPTLTPTRPPSTAHPAPTPLSTLNPPDWRMIAPGVRRVYLPVPTPGSDEPSYFYTLKIDPALATIKVMYDSRLPHTVAEWQAITKAPIVFNGAFFTGANKPNGMIVSDGVEYGAPLDYGNDSAGVRGLFAVSGHQVEIFAFGRSSYNPRGMKFDQAIESYPLLLLPGGQPSFPKETGKRSRRTVVALDQDNQLIVAISDIPLYSLYELSQWTATSNLGLDTALNLDGGRSTGIMVSLPDEEKLIDSYVPVPIVVAIYPLP